MKNLKNLFILILLICLSGHFLAESASAKKRAEGSSDSLAKVTQLRATYQDDGIFLSWKPVDNSDGYRIYYASGEKVGRNASSIDVDALQTSYFFSVDSQEGSYTFKVSALRGREEGRRSAPVTVEITAIKTGVRSDTAK